MPAYVVRMFGCWKPEVSGTGGATTLNVEALGPAAVKLGDGLTGSGLGDITAGRIYEIWHYGTGF